MAFIIDRFEGDYAVLEDGETIVNVPRVSIDENASEGDRLVFDGQFYSIDNSPIDKQRIQNKFDKLKKKKQV